MIYEDASVIELLRDAGAVLIAKVTTGELAGGDVWFGGRTNNPWKLDQGSRGSRAGPGLGAGRGLHRVWHRLGDERFDSRAFGALRHNGTATDLWPEQPLRRD